MSREVASAFLAPSPAALKTSRAYDRSYVLTTSTTTPFAVSLRNVSCFGISIFLLSSSTPHAAGGAYRVIVYFRRRAAAGIQADAKSSHEIVRGEIPPEEWRDSPLKCEIVQSIVIQEIGAAVDKDRAGLQEFLRSNGLIDLCVQKVYEGRGWGRRRAMLALGAMRVPEAVPPLSGLLDDWQFETRMAAVQSLGQTSLAEAAAPIIERVMVGRLKVPSGPIDNALVRCFLDRPEALLPYLRRSQGESRALPVG